MRSRGRRRSAASVSFFSFQDVITSVTGVVLFVTLMLIVELVTRQYYAPPVQTERFVRRLDEALVEAAREIEQSANEIAKGQAALDELVSASPLALEKERDELRATITVLQVEIDERQADAKNVERQRDRAADEYDSRVTDREQLAQMEREIEDLTKQIDELRTQNAVVYQQQPGAAKTAWLVELSEKAFNAVKPNDPKSALTFDQESASHRMDALLRWIATLDAGREYVFLAIKPTGVEAYESLFLRLTKEQIDLGLDLIEEDQQLVALDPLTDQP